MLDCLDGAHARATGQVTRPMRCACVRGVRAPRCPQCSKTGEILDHFVDTYGVPITAVALHLVMRSDALVFCVTLIGSILSYQASLRANAPPPRPFARR